MPRPTASGSQTIVINDEGLPVDPETGIVISISSARNAAWEKAKGQYGRVADAVKIIDPREE